MVIGELINNLGLLLALGILYSLLARSPWRDSLRGNILMGILFGAMCFVVMRNPMTLQPGVIFDTRSVVLSLAGLFGGPAAAAISVAIGAGYRIWLGGGGALAGVAGIIWVGLAGCLYRHMLGGQTGGISPLKIYIFGLVAQAGHVASILLLPGEIVWPALQKMTLPMMLVLPVGILLLGVLLADIRSRLDSELELRLSERRLRDILDYSPAKIYIKGRNYRYQLANREFLNQCGLELPELVGLTDYDFRPQKTAEALRKNDRMVLERGKVLEVVEELSYPDQGLSISNSIKFPLKDENGHIYALCGISTDITHRLEAQREKRILESRLSQAQKMEAIGTLAGGIAHDFNNLLTAIMGYSELAHHKIQCDEKCLTELDQVMKTTERARDLVRQILTFSRKMETRTEGS